MTWLLCLYLAQIQVEAPASINDYLSACQTRRDDFQNVKVDFEFEEVTIVGENSYAVSGAVTYALSGESTKTEYTGEMLNESGAPFSDITYSVTANHHNIESYHDGVAKQLTVRPTQQAPTGTISEEPFGMYGMEKKCLMANFIPTDIISSHSDWKALREETNDAGLRAIVFGNMDYFQHGFGATRTEITCLPDIDFQVQRISHLMPDGRLIVDAVLNYNAPKFSFVPERVQIHVFDRDTGKVRISKTLSAKDLEFNVALEDNYFDIVFPAGADVLDERIDLEYIAGDPWGKDVRWKDSILADIALLSKQELMVDDTKSLASGNKAASMSANSKDQPRKLSFRISGGFCLLALAGLIFYSIRRQKMRLGK